MPTTLGEYLNAKRGDRTVETIRGELETIGCAVEYTTVYRWFTAPPTGRYPRLKHWVALCSVLGLSSDEIAVARHLVADAE